MLTVPCMDKWGRDCADLRIQSGSFAEAAPISLSNSSIVGRLPFNFSGRLSASRYSDIPMGLLMSRSAYSAMKRSRVLHIKEEIDIEILVADG